MQAQALLFDMDGTLINSGEPIQFAWRNWAVRHGFDADEVYEYSHGRKAIATIRHFAPHADSEADAVQFHADIASQADKITALAGAKALLDQLNAGEWAVVTSAPRDLAQLSLTAAGLPLPGLIIGADQVSRSKPDPEGYAMAMRLLGAAPEQTIVFEDAEAGLQAGRAAGAQVVGVGKFRQHAGLTDAWLDDYVGLDLKRDAGLELGLPNV